MKLLLIGVGGVGCEFLFLLNDYLKSEQNLKINELNLELNVVIIDADTIELSNLHRQRLFKEKDIGRAKVEVAVECLKFLNSDIRVVPLQIKVEEINDSEFFEQFDYFVLAVDNLETRRWINSTVIQVNPSNGKWLILEMGVQGLKFSLRTVIPNSACLECSMSLYLQDDGKHEIPICSIYGVPRDLRDCVFWALQLDETRKKNIEIIYEVTKRRAQEFFIETNELSYAFIKNLMERTVPAVGSVNSLLAAQGLNILIQQWSKKQQQKNFWMTNLENGYYSFSTCLESDPDCFICSLSKQNN